MSLLSLLIQTCTIQSKSLAVSGYEQVPSWSNVATGVACRHEIPTNVSIRDSEYRKNTDDDLFFFAPATVISRGNRIILGSNTFDVINVSEVLDSVGVHHLEVTARAVDTK